MYLLESPRRGESNKYPRRMFSSKIHGKCFPQALHGTVNQNIQDPLIFMQTKLTLQRMLLL